jgi:hypothetical protein
MSTTTIDANNFPSYIYNQVKQWIADSETKSKCLYINPTYGLIFETEEEVDIFIADKKKGHSGKPSYISFLLYETIDYIRFQLEIFNISKSKEFSICQYKNTNNVIITSPNLANSSLYDFYQDLKNVLYINKK